MPPLDLLQDAIDYAYSYLRFSAWHQEDGDSLRRQKDLADAWCEDNGVPMDPRFRFVAKAQSAFKGKHRKDPDKNPLALFLSLVEGGTIRRGSYLLIESLDRLSREKPRVALGLLLLLIEKGIRVVQLTPHVKVFDEDVDDVSLLMAILEMSRAHGESVRKSDLVGKAWKEKKKLAREKKVVLTSRVPYWMRATAGGKALTEGQTADGIELIPDRAAAVRRIFELAAAGYGIVRIIRQLHKEKVRPFGRRDLPVYAKAGGRADLFSKTYVQTLLSDRRVLGELQPRGAGGRPEGKPVPGYYPAAVEERLFAAAQAARAVQRTRKSRDTKHVGLFDKLVRCARDGTAYTTRGSTAGRTFVARSSIEGHGGAQGFNVEVFEAAILSQLDEVDEREVFGGQTVGGDVRALEREKEDLEANLVGLVATAARRFSPSIDAAIESAENRLAEIASALSEHAERIAHPAAACLREAKNLLATLRQAEDCQDARVRLRSELRRVLDCVSLLVVLRGQARLAAVQMHFRDGEARRSFLILQRPAGNGHAERCYLKTLREEPPFLAFDLRTREDATVLEQKLASLDLSDLSLWASLSR